MSKTKETPSLEEYKAAKKIVDAYQLEQKRLYELRIEAFRIELTEYFANNLIDGFFKLEEFRLEDNNIIPVKPCMEERYNGGNNNDIISICEKHDVDFSIIYWCYHK